jgi:hypothetical protein
VTFTQDEGDRIYARLVETRDARPAEDGEAFLARLVLLLANEVGDSERVLRAIDDAAE